MKIEVSIKIWPEDEEQLESIKKSDEHGTYPFIEEDLVAICTASRLAVVQTLSTYLETGPTNSSTHFEIFEEVSA